MSVSSVSLNLPDNLLPALVFVPTVVDGWLVTVMKEAQGDGQTLTILTHVCPHRPFILLY
jgi:hypothetical protein